MIYVVQSGKNGPIKIGFAIEPGRRIRLIEKKAHYDLAEYRHRGEWFRPVPAVFEYIKNFGFAKYLRDEAGTARLVLWRSFKNGETDNCMFCGARHKHSPRDGHRIAHCHTTDAVVTAPYGTEIHQKDGYIVCTRG